jgi:hypothetical protein
MEADMFKISGRFLLTVVIFTSFKSMLLGMELVGSGGAVWPPLSISEVYAHYTNEGINLMGDTTSPSEATHLDLDTDGQWDVGEPLLLNHKAMTGAFEIGTAWVQTTDTIRAF